MSFDIIELKRTQKDYSHVGDILMLVTYNWWQLKNIDDRIKIFMIFLKVDDIFWMLVPNVNVKR